MTCNTCQHEILTGTPGEAARCHLETCAACRAFAAVQARLLAVAPVSVEPPAAVDAVILARARQAAFLLTPAAVPRRRGTWQRVGWAAAAAAAAVVAGLAYWPAPVPLSTPPGSAAVAAVSSPSAPAAVGWDDNAVAVALEQLEADVRSQASQPAGGYHRDTATVGRSIGQQIMDCEIELVFAADET